MDKKCKLVFFSSGDFPYYTIEQILSLNLYDVAGIVTSEYKSITVGSTIEDLANKYKIPCLKIRQNSELKSDKTLSWLKEKNADIFCVISFKYLPNEILSMPKITGLRANAKQYATFSSGLIAVWIGSSVTEYGITNYVFYNSINIKKMFIDLPRQTVEAMPNYSTAFSSGSLTTDVIICNDDSDFMTCEEFDAIDWSTYTG